jgi:hypothetical protein
MLLVRCAPDERPLFALTGRLELMSSVISNRGELGDAVYSERGGDRTVISSAEPDRVRRYREPKWWYAPLASPVSPAKDARDA